MKPGVGPLLNGHFHEAPQAQHWSDRLRSKASLGSFSKASPASLIVVSLYAHPLLSQLEQSPARPWNFKEAVRLALEAEYQQLLQFAQENDAKFGIAKTPSEARSLIKQKKIPLIISIEGAYAALEEEQDFKLWIEDRGVAIVTPFHLTQDHFGGTALLEGWRGINSPYEFFTSLMLSGLQCLKPFCKSPFGMTDAGRTLIDRLIRNGVWIDLAHANENSLREILPKLSTYKLPLLVTHTGDRSHYPAERGLGDLEKDYILKHNGMVGLIPTDDMIHNVKNKCKSGLLTFKEEVKSLMAQIGTEKVALGSDINAPLTGLSPICSESGNIIGTPFERLGFYTYTQWPELNEYVAPSNEWQLKTQNHFLELWDRIKMARQSPFSKTSAR